MKACPSVKTGRRQRQKKQESTIYRARYHNSSVQKPGEKTAYEEKQNVNSNSDKKIIEAANSSKILQQYEQNTQTAKDKSVFGSPTFIVGSELFWGDDRLEDAIEWARK